MNAFMHGFLDEMEKQGGLPRSLKPKRPAHLVYGDPPDTSTGDYGEMLRAKKRHGLLAKKHKTDEDMYRRIAKHTTEAGHPASAGWAKRDLAMADKARGRTNEEIKKGRGVKKLINKHLEKKRAMRVLINKAKARRQK